MKGTTKKTDRQVRAYQEAGSYVVLPASIEGNDWWVTKSSGTRYTVDATANTCTCPDHQNRQSICKHIHLVRFHLEADAPAPVMVAAPLPVAAADNPFAPVMDAEREARIRRDMDYLWG